ncbi:hypothetical protein MSS2_04752 [Mycobacterium marinum]|nr:hypothetical protein MSS2_04752 [Mycobacterium marinum]
MSMFNDPIFARTGHGGDQLLDDLLAVLTRYVVFTDRNSAVAVALWIATTHALPAFEFAPRLVLSSPEKRCGKTRTLDIIGGTCHKPLVSVNATVAAIYRSLGGEHPPTLIIDEADTLFGTKRAAEQNEDLRALLNAGHQRGRPALRCVGPQQIPTEFQTFAMAALAGIGSMPDTITDRAINVTQRRRAKGEKVAQFRARRDGPVLEKVRERLAAWAADHIGALSLAQPSMPVEDRAADTWEPLIALADAAGGHWPETGRQACQVLVAAADSADEDASLSVRLLADVRNVFAAKGAAFLASADLVTALRGIEESPWNDFDLSARKLAHRLRQFGIKPGHNTTKTARGYACEAFSDAFSRYTRPEPSDPSDTPAELQQRQDGSEPTDGSIRPDETIRPEEIAGQTMLGTGWTVPDGLAAENGSHCSCGAELIQPESIEAGQCQECCLTGGVS